jgi:hypothetical protein
MGLALERHTGMALHKNMNGVCPRSGQYENSPAIYRWVKQTIAHSPRSGRLKILGSSAQPSASRTRDVKATATQR